MSPDVAAVLNAGAFAGAALAVAGMLALAWKAFIAGVESAIGSRIDRLAQQQFEQDADFADTVQTVMARLATIEACLQDVRAQVYPNSGSSLRDRVDEVHAMVAGS
jgi:hypothetical protein